MVPGTGLEPARLASYAPQAHVSTIPPPGQKNETLKIMNLLGICLEELILECNLQYHLNNNSIVLAEGPAHVFDYLALKIADPHSYYRGPYLLKEGQEAKA